MLTNYDMETAFSAFFGDIGHFHALTTYTIGFQRASKGFEAMYHYYCAQRKFPYIIWARGQAPCSNCG